MLLPHIHSQLNAAQSQVRLFQTNAKELEKFYRVKLVSPISKSHAVLNY